MAALAGLIDALKRLPGIGPKSAQRIALHLLQHDRPNAERLAQALQQAVSQIRNCRACNTFTEDDLCSLCTSSKRDASLLCVVETPADLLSIEQTNNYSGLFYVLMGRLSPLDGVGPQEIQLERLLARITNSPVQEVVLATSFTTEGEATAHYLGELLHSRGIRTTRLARGVPAGSELEYLDASTLAHALLDRR